jgi:prepilin-type N-terminal cleavage/methylation domain-containing protein
MKRPFSTATIFTTLTSLSSLKSKIHSLYSELKSARAFTIIELLVVIAIIGILAAITLVSYSGVSGRAMLASLQSDLSSNSTQLKLYYATNAMYPITLDANNCPATPVPDTTRCLKFSSSTNFIYTPSTTTNPQSYTLATNKSGNYLSSSPITNICPLNFIVVPGSSTYGTNDFCVMKYEAKQVGATTTPISQASGLPWVNISQTTAIANAPNTKNQDGSTCTTCHLITEAEWMTIAQNVLGVASNWSSGVVGTGYIYSGHNDNVPGNAIEASADDTLGYTGTGNVDPSNQRRTLTLTNGEVIWDLSGNVFDRTAGTIAGSAQPGLAGEVAYAWKQWNNASLLQNGLPTSSMPSSTGVAGITWNSSAGVGQLYSNYGEVGARVFLRGGFWGYVSNVGVLNLFLSTSSGSTDVGVGFRVSR